MKNLLLILLTLAFASPSNAKPKHELALWPDGTAMDAFFSNTAKVDITKLGRQYVITDYGVRNDSSLV